MEEWQFQQMLTAESPSEVYHEASKLRPHDSLLSTINSVNSVPEIRKIIANPSTSHDGFPTFDLPRVGGLDQSLSEVLLKRKSSRDFSGVHMPVGDKAAILYFGSAVTRENVDEFGIKWGFRCAPSGGGLYPVDIYCVVNKVASLEAGLYAYDSRLHSLQLLSQCNVVKRFARATYLSRAEEMSVCILMAANFARSKFKYGERAYRFVLLEVGHICQNMLLVAECLGRSAFPLGGYIDDELNDLVGLDGCDQAVIYGLVAGCASKENRET